MPPGGPGGFGSRPGSQGRPLAHGVRTVRGSREGSLRGSIDGSVRGSREGLPPVGGSRGSTPAGTLVAPPAAQRSPTPDFMEEEVDTADDVADWLVDDVRQFLESPEWSAPLQTFVDANCIHFDATPDDEGRLEWTTLHDQFRAAVDRTLATHLGELGLSLERFVAAASSGGNKELDGLVRDYVLALDDFVVFRSVMMKRNIELELEALEGLDVDDDTLLQEAVAASLQPEEPPDDDDDADLQLALRLSREEAEARAAGNEEAAAKVAAEAEVVRERVRRKKRRKKKNTQRSSAAAADTHTPPPTAAATRSRGLLRRRPTTPHQRSKRTSLAATPRRRPRSRALLRAGRWRRWRRARSRPSPPPYPPRRSRLSLPPPSQPRLRQPTAPRKYPRRS
eukprot:TRINITY_DN5654_c0_g1_i3.p1 TRINITY_DN5654_c0_g1~~TRINITY_DN5654_c0_g1_i3.p1  ORF type:complete len:411 (+),score=149.09 TRINITY_DN5654_c0_g1_i3:49-1233(+)